MGKFIVGLIIGAGIGFYYGYDKGKEFCIKDVINQKKICYEYAINTNDFNNYQNHEKYKNVYINNLINDIYKKKEDKKSICMI
jgi:hypothetical protein